MTSTKFSYATSILIVKSTSSTCFSTTMPCVSGDYVPLTIANPIGFYDIMNKEQKEKQKTKQSHNKTNNKNSYLVIFYHAFIFFFVFFSILWLSRDDFLSIGCGGCQFLFLPTPFTKIYCFPFVQPFLLLMLITY